MKRVSLPEGERKESMRDRVSLVVVGVSLVALLLMRRWWVSGAVGLILLTAVYNRLRRSSERQ